MILHVYKLLLGEDEKLPQHENLSTLRIRGEDVNKILFDATYVDDHVIKHWRKLNASGYQLDDYKMENYVPSQLRQKVTFSFGTPLAVTMLSLWLLARWYTSATVISITVRAHGHSLVEGCNYLYLSMALVSH